MNNEQRREAERDHFRGNNDKIGLLVGGRGALLCARCPQQTGPARSQGAEGLKCEAALGGNMSRRFNWMATMGAILPWWSTNKIGGWGLSDRQKGLLIFFVSES